LGANLVSVLAVGGACAHGQVVLDGSVGAAGPLSGPNFQIPASLGTKAGSNLFHSFAEFNVSAGESATFSGPADVTRVFSRVTGGEPSNIRGTLRCTIPGADFFLINPAGVVFGPGAALDVQGSFAVTTADTVKLSDGGRFLALPGAAGDVLTTAAPAAFGFAGPRPAPVVMTQGAALEVPAGRSVSVVGGGIAILSGRVVAPDGAVALISPGSAGELKLTDAGGIDTSGFTSFNDIALADGAVVQADGGSGGGVLMAGFNAELDAAEVSADTTGGDGSRGVRMGLGGSVTIAGGSRVSADALGPARAGTVGIAAGAVVIRGGSSLSADAPDGGTVGAIQIRTAGALEVRDTSSVRLAAAGSASGGLIDVEAGSVLLDGTGLPAETVPRTCRPARLARARAPTSASAPAR
jgi:filamentous hemagglutinin family protein